MRRRSAAATSLRHHRSALAVSFSPAAYSEQTPGHVDAHCVGQAPYRHVLHNLRASGSAISASDSAARASSEAPQSMLWIPGGEFWMGSAEPMFPDARPIHKVYVDGFW